MSGRADRTGVRGGRLDIAIAGAGPGGLATALFLHRLGHRIHMFERFETPLPVGSGLLLQPTGQAVLAALGLLPRIAALGAPIDRLVGCDIRTGRAVLDLNYSALRNGQRGIGLHRALLFETLHDAVCAAGISITTGFALDRVEISAGRGRLHAGPRAAGPFDLIVDATGAGSPLSPREPGGRHWPLAFGALWANVPWIEPGFDRSMLEQRYRRADIMIGVLPVGRIRPDGPELASFFWSLPASRLEAVRARGIAAWRAEVTAFWPDVAPHVAAIGSFDDLAFARYRHRTLRRPLPVPWPLSATAPTPPVRNWGRAPIWPCSMPQRSPPLSNRPRASSLRSPAMPTCGACMCVSIRQRHFF